MMALWEIEMMLNLEDQKIKQFGILPDNIFSKFLKKSRKAEKKQYLGQNKVIPPAWGG